MKQHLPFKALSTCLRVMHPRQNLKEKQYRGEMRLWGDWVLVVGAYTTTKIPFTRSILVTAYMSGSNTAQTIQDMNNGAKYSESEGGESKTLYSLIRGLENYGPIVLRHSNIQLSSSVKLKSFFVNQTLKPIEWVTLLNINNSQGGCIFSVVQQVRSENAFCLEGTHWASISNTSPGKDDSAWEEVQLSSGFEDYYLSGQYLMLENLLWSLE